MVLNTDIHPEYFPLFSAVKNVEIYILNPVIKKCSEYIWKASTVYS